MISRILKCEIVIKSGGLAHLVEHLLCKQDVVGSTPTLSTKGSERIPFFWPYRLVVRTSPFHGGNRGSSPRRVTIGGLTERPMVQHWKCCVGEPTEGSNPSTSSSKISSLRGAFFISKNNLKYG